MAGNDDERPLLNVRVHPCGDGMSERLRVGLVQQGHTLEIDPAKLQDEFQPFLDAVGLGQRRKTLVKPGVHCAVGIAQLSGVVGVSCHALEAKE